MGAEPHGRRAAAWEERRERPLPPDAWLRRLAVDGREEEAMEERRAWPSESAPYASAESDAPASPPAPAASR